MTDDLLPAVELASGEAPDAAVIWLHGLGADGHDFEPVVAELQLPEALAIRFIFPHAPVQSVTLNAGMSMPSWFDIYSLESTERQDEAGIRASGAAIDGLIQRERERGVAPARIVVAGFSQGGAVALHTGLRYPESLAGIMALSTYLPLGGQAAAERSAANAATPILMVHGTQDAVLPFAFGARSRDRLLALDYNVEWHEYPMGHGVCPQELEHIRAWLIARLQAR